MDVVIAILGLGEAGCEIARDLVAAGAVVRGYDPRVPSPDGVLACTDEADASTGADLVLNLNSAQDAPVALTNARAALGPTTVFADLNTASARDKQQLWGMLEGSGFVDVALMSPVPGRGLRTPMLAAGPAAQRYRNLLAPLGASVTVLDADPGAAATHKLLRSVFYKGLAAAVLEALTAAERAGLTDWLRANITEELVRADATTLDRLVDGSHRHALRRSHEMSAATDLLTDLAVPPRIAAASRDLLAELAAGTNDARQPDRSR